MAVKVKIAVCGDMTPCSLVERYQYFRGIYIYILCLQNKTSVLIRRENGACCSEGERGSITVLRQGNRKELRHRNMMDRYDKMGDRNVRERRVRGKETRWSHLF